MSEAALRRNSLHELEAPKPAVGYFSQPASPATQTSKVDAAVADASPGAYVAWFQGLPKVMQTSLMATMHAAAREATAEYDRIAGELAFTEGCLKSAKEHGRDTKTLQREIARLHGCLGQATAKREKTQRSIDLCQQTAAPAPAPPSPPSPKSRQAVAPIRPESGPLSRAGSAKALSPKGRDQSEAATHPQEEALEPPRAEYAGVPSPRHRERREALAPFSEEAPPDLRRVESARVLSSKVVAPFQPLTPTAGLARTKSARLLSPKSRQVVPFRESPEGSPLLRTKSAAVLSPKDRETVASSSSPPSEFQHNASVPLSPKNRQVVPFRESPEGSPLLRTKSAAVLSPKDRETMASSSNPPSEFLRSTSVLLSPKNRQAVKPLKLGK